MNPAVDLADRLLSTSEVAAFLGIPVKTLHNWRGRGEGPPAYKIGKHLRFRPLEVAEWVAERRDMQRTA